MADLQTFGTQVYSGLDITKAATGVEALRLKDIASLLNDHVKSPFDIPTPREKVKKRPDGFDYVESSWMDRGFKAHSPLYASELLHYSESHGWITCIVRLTDRITGNSELGGASVRIQVKRGASDEPSFRDIVDKGNNVAAVITRAIKNAQSRFGHAADVYGKREAAQTDDEKQRYKSLYEMILKNHSQARAQQFEQGWLELGADFSEYLDKWETYMSKITSHKVTKSSTVEKSESSADGAAVNVEKSPRKLTF